MGGTRVFAVPDIAAERRADGCWLLRSRTPLDPPERSVARVVRRWAAARPDAPVLAERAPGGDWRAVTWGEAWDGRKLEMRVSGPNVTPGYLGDHRLTAASFDDEGFYAMGDAGRFLDPDRPERGVVFDGRVAEDFKLATGTWVSTGAVRTSLVGAGGGAIADAVIAAPDRGVLGALVWLAPAGDAAALRAAVEKHNADHPESSARITRALVLAEPPSIDGHEITDKGYINQRAALERRAAAVERLYAEPPDPDVLQFA